MFKLAVAARFLGALGLLWAWWAATPSAAAQPSSQAPPPVWVIVLENKGFEQTWGKGSQADFLNSRLRPQGALLTQYHGIGHFSLGNYLAMISGQPLSRQTQSDCHRYNPFVATGVAEHGVLEGDGCVYPATVMTLPDRLMAKGLRWKGYMEDMGRTPGREEPTCGRPLYQGSVALGAVDGTQSATATNAYAARHNPFIYFRSLVDSGACARHVVPLTELTADLADAAATPHFSFIVPNLCNDGHDGDGTGRPGRGCRNGDPGGLTSADAFLARWVPLIQASPAYQRNGLIVITFDEGELQVGPRVEAGGRATVTVTAEGEACCGQLLGPNVTRPLDEPMVRGDTTYVVRRTGVGGGRVGALLLSSRIRPGTVSAVPYNHYALLKSLQDHFDLPGYLGYAAQPGLRAFGSDIFNVAP